MRWSENIRIRVRINKDEAVAVAVAVAVAAVLIVAVYSSLERENFWSLSLLFPLFRENSRDFILEFRHCILLLLLLLLLVCLCVACSYNGSPQVWLQMTR